MLLRIVTGTQLWKEDAMTVGTVKWFNPAKGFGFIEPEDGSNDAFVHISAVQRAGMDSLREGQKVEYELVPGQNGKSSAENLVAID
jgi:CspA family cold shock protein